MNEILLAISDAGFFCWENKTGSAYRKNVRIDFGLPGIGDISVVVPYLGLAVTLYIEVKIPGDPQRLSQRNFEKRLKNISPRSHYALVSEPSEALMFISRYQKTPKVPAP